MEYYIFLRKLKLKYLLDNEWEKFKNRKKALGKEKNCNTNDNPREQLETWN